MPYVPRGAFFSGSYFRLNVGGIGADVGSGTVTMAAAPFLFQVNTVYAEASGSVRSLPGVDLGFRTRIVRLAAAVDLDRAVGAHGLSVGLIGAAPATQNDLKLSATGVTFLTAKEDRDIDLTFGLHWRGGTLLVRHSSWHTTWCCLQPNLSLSDASRRNSQNVGNPETRLLDLHESAKLIRRQGCKRSAAILYLMPLFT
ncbi:MAG: hypothetical protein ABSA52_02370 [Candidatus Binatia bacterium]